jgi:hypothetical protein
MQDKWCALSLGRRSYLQSENCSVPMLAVENFSHLGLGDEQLAVGFCLRCSLLQWHNLLLFCRICSILSIT